MSEPQPKHTMFFDIAPGNFTRRRERVRQGDTIIYLGDVAHPDAWRDGELMAELRARRGERGLIVGNHDVDNPVRPPGRCSSATSCRGE